jgi:hypothetical protein
MKNVKGATIHCMGLSVVVDKVLYAHHENIGWDVEFIDTAGQYRHWKQWDDGGNIEFPTKKLVNEYGVDYSDIFHKYGYKV